LKTVTDPHWDCVFICDIRDSLDRAIATSTDTSDIVFGGPARLVPDPLGLLAGRDPTPLMRARARHAFAGKERETIGVRHMFVGVPSAALFALDKAESDKLSEGRRDGVGVHRPEFDEPLVGHDNFPVDIGEEAAMPRPHGSEQE
jgi:hypothetical protein